MKIGLHLSDFTFPSGPRGLAVELARVVAAAEEAGFARVSVMDHVWQIAVHGPPEHEMLEAYTTLGYLAAHTSRVDLLAWVTAVSYREPGMLAKLISTLDVLSDGRAWLGIGAAWNEPEARGLGLAFPPLAERFERLEETLQICNQMWDPDNDGPFHGVHYHLERTLNVPQPLHRPKILIGGGGERKTLRLVAKYADACNLFAGPELERKLDVLRAHCETEGRPYDAIEKTAQVPLDLGERGEKIDAFLGTLAELGKLGIQAVQGKVPQVWEPERIALFQREVIPAAAEL
jgi:F420-dependent oxidoreductase-like protein